MPQKNTTKTKQGASWGTIIFLVIFFFFAGIPLMLHKLHKDKANMLTNAKRTMTVGWIIFGLGIVYLVLGLTGDLTYEDGTSAVGMIIVMVALCCGGGYAIVRNAKKYKNLGLMYERYLPVVSASATGSLDDISEAIGEVYDVTADNIQKLIYAGLFENSYIDKTRRSFVSPLVSSMPRPQQGYSAVEHGYVQTNRGSAPKTKTVKCPNCGGVNTVTEGAENICDFCDSPLE